MVGGVVSGESLPSRLRKNGLTDADPERVRVNVFETACRGGRYWSVRLFVDLFRDAVSSTGGLAPPVATELLEEPGVNQRREGVEVWGEAGSCL